MKKIKLPISKTSVLFFNLILSLISIFCLFSCREEKILPAQKKSNNFEFDNIISSSKIEKIKDPPSIQVYYSIEKWAEEYRIPKKFAYAIAFYETKYQGPFDWDYQPFVYSERGAIGPMQIMPMTAKTLNGNEHKKEKLKSDIDYNVKTSMKLLRRLKDKYKNWRMVFGCYNTGKPVINQYAKNIYAYQPQWKKEI